MLEKKIVSIITVNYNNLDGLFATIKSVLEQESEIYQYIIIDGFSTDGSQELIKEYSNKVDVFISETDEGIYDAMNKGISHASCEWVIFMNSGDLFYDNNILCNFQNTLSKYKNCDFVYSDTLRSDGKVFHCSSKKDRIIHQSVFYKKKLHDIHGKYISCRNFITADFFFFKLCRKYNWLKVDYTISKIDVNGVSNSSKNYFQKTIIQYLFKERNFFLFLLRISIHRILFKLKNYYK